MSIKNLSSFIPSLGFLDGIVQKNQLHAQILLPMIEQLLYGRAFAKRTVWDANNGETRTFNRGSTLSVNLKPATPGKDPVGKSSKKEQYKAQCTAWNEGVDIDLKVAAAALPGHFADKTNELGINCAQTMNGLYRQKLFAAYGGGHAVANNTSGAGTTLEVSSILGFTENMKDSLLLDVSPTNPKPILIGASTYALVVAATPVDPAFPYGSGTLTLSANAAYNAGDTVVAMDAPVVIYAGGGTSVDAISDNDVLTPKAIRDAVSVLKKYGTPRVGNMKYECHIGSKGTNDMFDANELQRMLQSRESEQFADFVLGSALGCTFIDNNFSPDEGNTGNQQSSRPDGAPLAKLADGIYGEVVNAQGVKIERTVIFGADCGELLYKPPGQFMSAAGMQGELIGGFNVSADNMSAILDEAVRFIINKPQNALQDMVKTVWEFIGDQVLPSDQYGGGYNPAKPATTTRNARYKRAVVIVHA